MNNQNLIELIIKFLHLKDIIQLSFVNKFLKVLLDNKQILYINDLWREKCDDEFYNNEISEKITDKNVFSNDNINFFNWKDLYKQFVNNKNKFKIGKISNDIYKIMKLHLFMPKIRKSVPYIENQFFSKHQIFFLDFKNFEKNYLKIKQNINCVQYSIEYKEILEDIFNYQNLENYEISNTNNNDIQFIIWLYQTISLFCLFNYQYLLTIKTNEKIFINEYLNRYNNFVDIALQLKDKYEIINDNLNKLNNSNFGNKKFFSIYIMIYNIWYNKVYTKLANIINNSIYLIMDYTLLNESYEKDECSTNITILNIDEYEIRNNITLINDIGISILDFSIDKDNVMFINHTHLKVNIYYEQYEKIILSWIYNFIEKVAKNKSNWKEYIFNWLNNFLLLSDKNDISYILDKKNFFFITRSKYFLLEKIILFLNPIIKKELDISFLNFINLIKSNNKFIENYNKENYLDLTELVKKKVMEEENYIRQYLKDLMKNTLNISNSDNLINIFFAKNGQSNIEFIRKLSIIYYQTLEKMENLNNIIDKLIPKLCIDKK